MKLSLIVLTSFSPAAQQALHYADGLAAQVAGQVVLLHAKRVSLFDPYVFAGKGPWRQELASEAEVEAILARQAARLQSPATVEIATDLLPELAQDLMSRYYPAVFVIGRPAPNPTAPEELSAMVVELLQAAHLPVLVVPLHTKAANPAQRLLIAADSDGFALTGAAAGVCYLLRHLGSQGIAVAHVSVLEEAESSARAMHAVQHSGLLAGLPTPALLAYQALRPARGVVSAAREAQADLVVVLARPRSFLGELFHQSVTVQVMHESPVPVLVVPTAEPTATAAQPESLKVEEQVH